MTLRIALSLAVVVALGASAASAVTYDCAASPQARRCSGVLVDGATFTSEFTVIPGACAAGALIEDANVSVRIVHQNVGDLSAVLVHPDGTRVQLLHRPGLGRLERPCDGDDVDVRFDDEADADWDRCESLIPALSGDLAPFNPLGTLDGKPRNGVWSLEVRDEKGGDFGALVGWSLNLPCALPVVSVKAVDALAREKAGDDALFLLTRTGDLASPLVVRIALSGTASAADYQPLPPTVTFAAGKATLDVPLIAVVDDVFEPEETVTLTAVLPGDYTVGDAATVRIAADGCGDGKVDPAEACDDGNDIDGDGCQNTCELTPLDFVGDEGCDCQGTGGSLLAAFALLVPLMRRRRG